MINFCTLYNSNYSAKGLAMYYSLLKHCESFHLYVFAFDEMLEKALKKMKLKHVTVVSLMEFENEELLRVKQIRTAGEYCWTCSSSTIWYCINHYKLDSCTYIDADLYFYSDPQVLIDEMGDKDVSIISHRYTSQYDQTKTSGKYCVQFMTFKNTPNGMKILKWWRDACLDWCYARYEDGKFGDQKYLDDWTTRFEGVHEIEHLGGGVAPWNMQQYTFTKEGGKIVGREVSSNKEFPLVFFHFHNLISFRYKHLREFWAGSYDLPDTVKSCIYKPYINKLICSFFRMKFVDRRIDGVATRSAYYNSYRDGWHFIKSRRNNKDHKYFYWLS